MQDGDSGAEPAYPNTVSARLTHETYDKLKGYADEYTGGQITVAAREAIREGVGGYKERAEELERERDDLARERDRLQNETEELRARLEDPDVIDWLDVTRNTSDAVMAVLAGVLVVTVGFGLARASVWAETVLGVAPPGWLLSATLTVALAGVSLVVVTVLARLGLGAVRWARG
jgi:hypothetical protein